jgi:hypothetical protein
MVQHCKRGGGPISRHHLHLLLYQEKMFPEKTSSICASDALPPGWEHASPSARLQDNRKSRSHVARCHHPPQLLPRPLDAVVVAVVTATTRSPLMLWVPACRYRPPHLYLVPLPHHLCCRAITAFAVISPHADSITAFTTASVFATTVSCALSPPSHLQHLCKRCRHAWPLIIHRRPQYRPDADTSTDWQTTNLLP